MGHQWTVPGNYSNFFATTGTINSNTPNNKFWIEDVDGTNVTSNVLTGNPTWTITGDAVQTGTVSINHAVASGGGGIADDKWPITCYIDNGDFRDSFSVHVISAGADGQNGVGTAGTTVTQLYYANSETDAGNWSIPDHSDPADSFDPSDPSFIWDTSLPTVLTEGQSIWMVQVSHSADDDPLTDASYNDDWSGPFLVGYNGQEGANAYSGYITTASGGNVFKYTTPETLQEYVGFNQDFTNITPVGGNALTVGDPDWTIADYNNQYGLIHDYDTDVEDPAQDWVWTWAIGPFTGGNGTDDFGENEIGHVNWLKWSMPENKGAGQYKIVYKIVAASLETNDGHAVQYVFDDGAEHVIRVGEDSNGEVINQASAENQYWDSNGDLTDHVLTRFSTQSTGSNNFNDVATTDLNTIFPEYEARPIWDSHGESGSLDGRLYPIFQDDPDANKTKCAICQFDTGWFTTPKGLKEVKLHFRTGSGDLYWVSEFKVEYREYDPAEIELIGAANSGGTNQTISSISWIDNDSQDILAITTSPNLNYTLYPWNVNGVLNLIAQIQVSGGPLLQVPYSVLDLSDGAPAHQLVATINSDGGSVFQYSYATDNWGAANPSEILLSAVGYNLSDGSEIDASTLSYQWYSQSPGADWVLASTSSDRSNTTQVYKVLPSDVSTTLNFKCEIVVIGNDPDLYGATASAEFSIVDLRDGATGDEGPAGGVVAFRGQWEADKAYSAGLESPFVTDVVKSSPTATPPDTYYKKIGSDTDGDDYETILLDGSQWEEMSSFGMVGTDLLLAQEAYVHQKLIVGPGSTAQDAGNNDFDAGSFNNAAIMVNHGNTGGDDFPDYTLMGYNDSTKRVELTRRSFTYPVKLFQKRIIGVPVHADLFIGYSDWDADKRQEMAHNFNQVFPGPEWDGNNMLQRFFDHNGTNSHNARYPQHIPHVETNNYDGRRMLIFKFDVEGRSSLAFIEFGQSCYYDDGYWSQEMDASYCKEVRDSNYRDKLLQTSSDYHQSTLGWNFSSITPNEITDWVVKVYYDEGEKWIPLNGSSGVLDSYVSDEGTTCFIGSIPCDGNDGAPVEIDKLRLYACAQGGQYSAAVPLVGLLHVYEVDYDSWHDNTQQGISLMMNTGGGTCIDDGALNTGQQFDLDGNPGECVYHGDITIFDTLSEMCDEDGLNCISSFPATADWWTENANAEDDPDARFRINWNLPHADWNNSVINDTVTFKLWRENRFGLDTLVSNVTGNVRDLTALIPSPDSVNTQKKYYLKVEFSSGQNFMLYDAYGSDASIVVPGGMAPDFDEN